MGVFRCQKQLELWSCRLQTFFYMFWKSSKNHAERDLGIHVLEFKAPIGRFIQTLFEMLGDTEELRLLLCRYGFPQNAWNLIFERPPETLRNRSADV